MKTEQRLEIPLGQKTFNRGAEAGEATRWEPSLCRFVTNVQSASLTLHLPLGLGPLRTMILICPGGGYNGVSIDKEGHWVASWLNANGIAAAVLKYRYPGLPLAGAWPRPFEDALEALRCMMEHAEDWAIDPAKIGVMGFSAGGHLAGSLGLCFHELTKDRTVPKPAFLALIYPVISADPACGHRASFESLTQGNLTPEAAWNYSLENHVGPQSPPAFLFHAEDDASVPVLHSRRLQEAYRQAGREATLVTSRTGGHGFGMGREGQDCAVWPERFLSWLQQQPGLVTSETLVR